MRWAERLSAVDFDVEYMRGLDNIVANVLLQLPLPSSGYALPEISCNVTLKWITGYGLMLAECCVASSIAVAEQSKQTDNIKLGLSKAHKCSWPFTVQRSCTAPIWRMPLVS